MVTTKPAIAAAAIQKRAPNFKPKLGLILGSGLGDLASQVQQAIRIPYSELPNFPVSTVFGHAGQLVLGELAGLPVACLQGRVHSYEGATVECFKTIVRTLKLLGCEILVITNSAGSLRSDVAPGELALITDHINFQPSNPLVGLNEDEFGERFFSMDDAYDPKIQQRLHKVAAKIGVKLADGIYISVLGPSFETPAEIRAFRLWGADLVGMSTVPEVIVARHCGLRVAAISVITNFAAGMSAEAITHEGTLHYGKLGSHDMARLLAAFIEDLKHEPD